MRFALITFLIAGSLVCAMQAQTPFANLKPEIEKLIAASGAEKVGVAVYDLEFKQSFLLNEGESFHAASTMKLPVMMEIFRRANDKKLNLLEKVEVKNRFFSVADGSEYRLRREDDIVYGLEPIIRFAQPDGAGEVAVVPGDARAHVDRDRFTLSDLAVARAVMGTGRVRT